MAGIPFVPQSYDPTEGAYRLANLIMQSGDQQAQARAAKGDIWARTLANLGQTIGQGITDARRDKMMQQQVEAQTEERQAQADLRKRQIAQMAETQRAEAEHAARVQQLWSSDKIPSEQEIMREYGDKGPDVIKSLGALHPQPKYQDKMEALRDAARGIQAQPPQLRAQAYDLFRQGMERNGILSPGEAPPQYDEATVNSLAAYGGVPAEKPETRSLEVQAAEAQAKGDTAALQKLLGLHKQFTEAGRSGEESLVKVEHMDPETGRTVIEYVPKGELRGQAYQKGLSGTEQVRATQAQTVNDTGNEIIKELSDPKIREQFGLVAGRYNTLREFIGNPPPEFARIAGMIESYSLANMGVHGMRSSQGAEKIKKLLDEKQTPESLIAKIQGLNEFSKQFVKNTGIPIKESKPEGDDPLRMFK